ncbi:ABC transporter permease [Hydrotalea sandarakina]|jgi:putative ABC transport system permease protein|uniref:Putative ABC transport system permease protein n=1 Tax=Hydrotalea sandarakina TaxID=1004304 RepID=A0A2W7RR93_9BACT|nr:ABC transporter permease [Hydrotalea sandarakina]PZX62911.1 putative ABC transport system permease protein [Hydrotalea sandarakina]
MEFYLSALVLSLCLGAMSMGVFISMRIFNIPDITTDGSYTLGAAVTALLLVQHWPVYIVVLISMLSGSLAGICTAFIHTKLKIDALLAGILVMTGLYSINLIIMGRSNIPLINLHTLFSYIQIFPHSIYNTLATGIIIIGAFAILLWYILLTDFGIAMRATGNSSSMTRSLGINNNKMKIIGLAMANALTALSGSLVAQYQNFTDINMGIGIVIVGLGSVLIADALRIWFNIVAIGAQIALVIAGSFIFQMVLAVTLSLGVDPNILKLVTALFVLLIVALPRVKNVLKPNE